MFWHHRQVKLIPRSSEVEVSVMAKKEEEYGLDFFTVHWFHSLLSLDS